MELKEFTRELAILTHDLHNSIRGALWASELGLERPDKSQREIVLSDIRDRLADTLHILHDTELRLMSLDDSWDRLSFEKCPIHHLRRTLNSSIPKHILDEKSLSLSMIPSDFIREKHIYILCDRYAIKHAFWHVLRNAARYSYFNREIRIGIAYTTSENVNIFIENYGGPIAPDDISNLTKFEWTGSNSIHGLGRGLWVVKKIMKAHSGSISFIVNGNVTRVNMVFPTDIT